jgi:predicted nucleotidyltransferase
MQPTKYPDINNLLSELLSQIKKIFGKKLIGFYLYGSLVWGDFDYDISDIDLLAALESDVNDQEFIALEKMHKDFTDKYKEWNDRIEVQYFSKKGLKTFKFESSKMVKISPGEPLNITDAGNKKWLTNWYFVQDYGITLFGPDPKTIIEPISKEEFIQAVKEHALDWREYVLGTKTSRGYQAYAILTLCRAFYTIRNGEQVSKHKAASWVKQQLPQYAELIDNAFVWRQAKVSQGEKVIDNEATFPETKQFIEFIIDKIEK